MIWRGGVEGSGLRMGMIVVSAKGERNIHVPTIPLPHLPPIPYSLLIPPSHQTYLPPVPIPIPVPASASYLNEKFPYGALTGERVGRISTKNRGGTGDGRGYDDQTSKKSTPKLLNAPYYFLCQCLARDCSGRNFSI